MEVVCFDIVAFRILVKLNILNVFNIALFGKFE